MHSSGVVTTTVDFHTRRPWVGVGVEVGLGLGLGLGLGWVWVWVGVEDKLGLGLGWGLGIRLGLGLRVGLLSGVRFEIGNVNHDSVACGMFRFLVS